MNKSSYLIVKTGKSGSKLNDLYDTEVLTESGKVKLCSTRLLGTWYQSIVRATKRTGVTGTLSVLKHDPDTADLLLAEYQATFLRLKNDINWRVVARLDISDQELQNTICTASDAEWMRIAQDGLVTPIRPRSDGNFTKFKWNINRDGMPYLEYKRQLKELKKTCKERVAAAGEAAISNRVKLIEV